MNRKTYLIAVIALIVSVVLFYFFAFEYIVPGAAKLAIPYQWKTIPMKQDTAIVHSFLGTPAQILNDKGNVEEEWYRGSKNQLYILKIQYDRRSNIATGYQIEYHFEKWLFHKTFLLEERKMN